MAKKIKRGYLLIVVGVLLLFVLHSTFLQSRTDTPVYDEDKDYFQVEILDHQDVAREDDSYWVELEVFNPQLNLGRMYVQCSLLDRDEHDWIGRTSYTRLDEDDNCVRNEPFTQTMRVTLGAGKREEVRFNMEVPSPGRDDVIWCGAFERCYDEGDALMSDEDSEVIMIYGEGRDECDHNNDCGSNEECVNGVCREECDDDDDCEDGFTCSSDACVPDRDACEDDDECSSNEECRNGECIDEDELSDECDRDSDCASDEECVQGTCYEQCDRDSDCRADEVCSDDACVPEEDACEDDNDCRSDEYCTDGVCVDEDDDNVRDEDCDTKTDCKGWLWGGVDCRNGRCVDTDNDIIDFPELDDRNLEDWAEDHRALIFIIALAMVILGFLAVYYEPKRPKDEPKRPRGLF